MALCCAVLWLCCAARWSVGYPSDWLDSVPAILSADGRTASTAIAIEAKWSAFQMGPLGAENRFAVMRAESSDKSADAYPPRVYFSVYNAAMTEHLRSLQCDMWPDDRVHVTVVPSPAADAGGAAAGRVELYHRRGVKGFNNDSEAVVSVSDLNDCVIAVSMAGYRPIRSWTHCTLSIE
jgi:hypothetical protein